MEQVITGTKTIQVGIHLYEQIHVLLYFAGGESTIIEEHYTLLEEVVKRGYAHKIELRYNPNAVEMSDRLFELWSKSKRVRFTQRFTVYTR